MSLEPQLAKRQIPSVWIDFNKKEFMRRMRSGQFSTCVIVQLGSGGDDEAFFSDDIKTFLKIWVHNGGKLIIQGETTCLKVFNDWFGKSWAFKGDFYRRTYHDLNPHFSAIPALASPTTPMSFASGAASASASAAGVAGVGASPSSSTSLLPPRIDAKACMLANVDMTERLYVPTAGAVSWSLVKHPQFDGVPIVPDMCLMAVSQYGRGLICFNGDINGERTASEAIAVIGSS